MSIKFRKCYVNSKGGKFSSKHTWRKHRIPKSFNDVVMDSKSGKLIMDCNIVVNKFIAKKGIVYCNNSDIFLGESKLFE